MAFGSIISPSIVFSGGGSISLDRLIRLYARDLRLDYILHYQKIIVALKRTDELMKEIDSVFTFT